VSNYSGGAAPQLDPEVIERLRRMAMGPPAEPPRAPRFAPARLPLVLVAVVAVLGFLLVTVSASVTEADRANEPRRARLANLIKERQQQVGDLADQVERLRADVATRRRDAAQANASDAAVAAVRDQLALVAGVVAVKGPGLEVRMNDSSRPLPLGEEAEAYRIHDRDLQLIVNALALAGAEAIAVNGVRLVATSPIRSAGDTITVGFRPVAPPYTIVAIGAGRQAFVNSHAARQFAKWRDDFGLGFRVRTDDELDVPAFAGRLAVAHANPVGE
jgi:uncharacterized protein YlxW (UPF0749 family)